MFSFFTREKILCLISFKFNPILTIPIVQFKHKTCLIIKYLSFALKHNERCLDVNVGYKNQ